MRYAIGSWSWRLLLAGAMLFVLMGQQCTTNSTSCENASSADQWFECVWANIQSWF